MSPKRKRILLLSLPLIGFVVLLALLLPGLWHNPRELPSVLLGQPMPEFALTALENPEQVLTPADLRGDIALLNVWATWCTACRLEHDMLLQLAEQGVPIYGINYKDERDKAIEWLYRLGDPYRLNIEDAEGRLGIDLGVYGAPETFLLDAEGVIQHRHAGPLDPEVWREAFLPRIRALRGQS